MDSKHIFHRVLRARTSLIQYCQPQRSFLQIRFPSSLLRPHQITCSGSRQFCSSPVFRSDGVYKELTNMRVKTPWIEALRAQQAATHGSKKEPNETKSPPMRVLKPKKMSESFHRGVGLLSRPENPVLGSFSANITTRSYH